MDYRYLSTTNSSAFSPTDPMPLPGRTKILMGVQATAALVTPGELGEHQQAAVPAAEHPRVQPCDCSARSTA